LYRLCRLPDDRIEDRLGLTRATKEQGVTGSPHDWPIVEPRVPVRNAPERYPAYHSAMFHVDAVDLDSINANEVELTHVDLNDQALEGLRDRTLPLFSVQYHPEAAPGPHDSHYLFGDFRTMVEEWKA